MEAPDPGFAGRVRASFARQAAMGLIGATLERVEPGAVDIALPFRADLTQQDGYLHAAMTSAIADSACGYAALTLTPAGSEVLAVEFKVDLLRPAVGVSFLAEGRVLKPGRTLTRTRAEVFALREGEGERVLVATMTNTILVRDAG